MKIDIDQIINNCVDNLDLDDNEVSIDAIYKESYEAVDEIIGNIALGITNELEKRNIEITY